MHSYEDRMRTVELYITYGCSATGVIRGSANRTEAPCATDSESQRRAAACTQARYVPAPSPTSRCAPPCAFRQVDISSASPFVNFLLATNKGARSSTLSFPGGLAKATARGNHTARAAPPVPRGAALLLKLLNFSCSRCPFPGDRSDHFLVNINTRVKLSAILMPIAVVNSR